MTDFRFGPDRLDDLWDAIGASSMADETAHDDEWNATALIRVLEAGAPTMTETQRIRINRSILYPAQGLLASAQPASLEAGSMPEPAHTGIPATSRPLRKRLEHPFLQIAATILLLLGILGAWFVTRTGNPDPKTTPVGSINSPAPQEQPPLEPLLYISVPAADATRELIVIVRRIEIAPGGHWSAQIDEANQPDSDAALALASGSVNATSTDGASTTYNQPGRIELPTDGRLEITNTNDSAALLVEFSMSPNGTGAEAVSPADKATVNSSEMSPPYIVPTGYPATLDLWNPIGLAISQFVTPPSMELIYGVVDRGMYTSDSFSANLDNQASPTDDGSIPQPYSLAPGDTISSAPGEFPNLRAANDDASILLVSARQLTTEDIARQGTHSEVSFSSEQIQLDLRSVTIQPGGRYAFRLTGSVITWGVSGTGSIASSLSEDSSAIVSNLYTRVFGSGEFSITADGNEPVTFLLALVSQDSIEMIESLDTSVTIAGGGEVLLPLGSHSLRFSLDASAGIEVNPSAQETALTLISAGEAELTPLTEITLHTGAGAKTLAPFTGPITLSPGDWFITEPGDGYRLARSDAASQIARITLSPIVSPERGTPVSATPLSESSEAQAEAECTIAPRSLDDYEQILATPYSEGDPAVNHRGDTDSAPADPATIAGVTESMRQLLACNRLETLYQHYSLYSIAAIRYQASLGNLNLESLEESSLLSMTPVSEQGPLPDQLVIDQVSIFPDGRAGAWVSANAEIAYVTFVYEGGQWLIDFWDDSQLIATPAP